MGIFDRIQATKQKFQEKREEARARAFQNREEKLARLNNERLKSQAERQQKEEIKRERKLLFEAKTQGVREGLNTGLSVLQSVGQNKRNSGLNLYGSQVRGRFGRNAKQSSSAGSIFSAPSNSPNNIYTSMSSGYNPYVFTSSKKMRKR